MTRKGQSQGTTTPIEPPSATPGDGIRTLKTSGVFRAVNFELYAKPVRLLKLCNILTLP
jgi:hypothetical protein